MENYLKYTSNIPAQFFCYLLFYMEPNNYSIIISGITDFSITDIFTLILMKGGGRIHATRRT